ncbi:Bcr/CflA family drug resistance efflux transporter (plasmid) [Cellulomonas sp. WB94]|nr:Bcr/CflA family drug resistance efflux transporter [Cellulomonas sp. WB94]
MTAALIGTLALQSAIPPFATDMYTPAFPQVTLALATQATLVGLTLTAFFVGLGAGQLVGGPVSDQRGRRVPLIVGGVLCTLGAIACALAPSIWFLVAARLVQGFGGGIAAAVARAVLIDVARGDRLARLMSVLMAIGGLAPMIAPVAGAAVVTAGTWRTVFWALAALGALMIVTAVLVVPETLPVERRRRGGLRHSVGQFGEVLRIRSFVGYTLTSAFSAFTMMAYIANASYVLQVGKGMGAMAYAMFFASTALAQILLTLVNARLVGRIPTRRLIGVGLTASTAAVVALTLGVGLWGTPLILTCAGFLLLMAVQAFIFGNSAALGAAETTHAAGSAAGLQGVVQAIAMAVAAPLASAGGGSTAWPMVAVMLVGVGLAWVSLLLFAPRGPGSRAARQLVAGRAPQGSVGAA